MIKGLVYTIFLSISFIGLVEPIFSSDAKQKGLELALKMREKNSGFVGESSEMEMILINSSGEKISRLMEGKTQEVSEEGDKSLITFLSPKDVRGTKMLTWAHRGKTDDQWLYLPSFRRVKRISSNARSSSFMGSEFSYEDLGSQEVEKFDYQLLSENDKSYSLERKSKDGQSGYSKQVLELSKKYWNPTKIEYFDRKGELLKTAVFDNFVAYQVKGKTIYRSNKVHMKNIQTKKQSIINWKKRELGLKFKKRELSQKSLK